MNSQREQAYERLEKQIGRTPLYVFSLPNGHKAYAKAEFMNPTGSHYDRVYIKLLKELENDGRITPGETPLIETTSGNAGSAFAWLCNELGYDCTVIIPGGLPKARVDDIRKYGAKIRFSDKDKYVRGAAEELKRVLTQENKERKAKGLPKFWSPNHSQDMRSADALESIANEALDELKEQSVNLDYFIAAIGNGSFASLVSMHAVRCVAAFACILFNCSC